ncbi:MAG: ribosome assembly RNA-binding protein YhbY [Candidatus Lambdaproteobacteria bacterium]|nr:ribosome assembly RNA-binding protein YhbY [Candidatus Lambdaproteobacteria bacterium]
MAAALTGKQKRTLRGLGHGLRPAVQIGKQGLAPALLAEIDAQLLQHELIKVKVLETCPLDRLACAAALADATGGTVAQQLGRTVLLYRAHPERPVLALPRAGLPGGAAAAAGAPPTKGPSDER